VGLGVRYHATLTDLASTVGPVEITVSGSWYVD
jgi:hypothetical protein